MTAPGRARELFSAVELASAVRRLGAAVSAAHPDGVVLAAVLAGSVWFAADLVRCVDVPCRIDFLAISPYTPGTGRVAIVKDLDHDIDGADVVLVEDIIDTGLTVSYLLGELGRRGPRRLEVCTLLDRRTRRIVPVEAAFVGLEVPEDFLIGYGLDYAGRYRNLDHLFAADLAALGENPLCHAAQLYGTS